MEVLVSYEVVQVTSVPGAVILNRRTRLALFGTRSAAVKFVADLVAADKA